MAKGLTLDIAANTRDFQKGIGDVEKALDDVADALDDVAKDGDKATEKLEDSFRDMAKAAKKAGDDAGDDLGRGIKKGTDKSTDSIKEIGNEAESTGKEFAASFDGSIESVAGGFQELAANAFAGFGPAGVVAGAAGAIGIGAVTAELQKQQEMADELRDRLIGAYLGAAEEGRIALTNAEILANITETISNPDAFKAAQEDAKKLGVTTTDYLRAISGDEQVLNDVRAAGRQAQASALEEQEGGYVRELTALEQISGRLDAVAQANQTGHDAAREYLAAQDDLSKRNEASANSSIRAIEGTAAALNAVPDAKTIRIGVDSKAYDDFVKRASNGFTVPISPRVAERQVYP